jgi:hypothetical protein
MSGAVAVIASAIWWPVVVLMLWIGGATLAAAERCRARRLALGLLNLGAACGRVARGMLPPSCVLAVVILLSGCAAPPPAPEAYATLAQFSARSSLAAAKLKCLDDPRRPEADNWRCILALDPNDRAAQLALASAERKREAIDKRCVTPTKIGMTERQAIDSCWGEPDSINTTDTGRHHSAQWVYPGIGYLYFSDGILVAKQTAN